MTHMIREDERETPVVAKVDVVVAGGGPAGFAAAVAAARNGAGVLLIERYGFLGGMCTAGYVTLLPTWNLVSWNGEKEPLVGGIASEIVAKLDNMGASVKPIEAQSRQSDNPILPYWPAWFQFDFEAMKIAMFDMTNQAKVKLLLHSYVAGVIKVKNELQGLIVENKSGRQAILAETIIDATGDGDVSALSGAEFEQVKGRNVMPVTLPFYVGNVDSEKVKNYLKQDPGLRNLLKEKGSALIEGAKDVLRVPAFLLLSCVDLPMNFPSKYIQFTRNGEWYIWGAHSFGRDVTD